jgi:hypothetical protein
MELGSLVEAGKKLIPVEVSFDETQAAHGFQYKSSARCAWVKDR